MYSWQIKQIPIGIRRMLDSVYSLFSNAYFDFVFNINS